ncbi:hypothetical protein Mal4_17360 [Maioricimonas rarisocia]|uniref:Uncharacterized protein n=1 Tax=Maioricimonas rarisocia TaxID=2528026 RepID=A0A517Z4M3_9PLAN|nr:hypothetical protein [Maioricimonas rarisocia]QDU37424.1 hypothetical protein Mal4_17360 [Maioricimonas rarisocia]
MRLRRLLPLVCAVMLVAISVEAAIFPQDRGAWPEDWPEVLEPLRMTSKTIGVGTGIQENIYEIPIADAETFEKVWPEILKLRTPGSRLTLYRASAGDHPTWGQFLSNERAAIRIFAPTGGFSTAGDVEIDVNNPPDFEELIREGKALRAGSPWPESLMGENGELPQYVVSEKQEDGTLQWVAADPYSDDKSKPRGFYNRARIDVELVVDGAIIDLNRMRLPADAVIVDRRFDDAKADSGSQ